MKISNKKRYRLSLSKIFSTLITLLFFSVFTLYLAQNFSPILGAILGQGEDISPTPTPQAFTPANNLDDSSQSVDIIIGQDGLAVEFVEEHIPQIFPDPTRPSGSIVNTVIAGGTPVSNFYVNDTSNSGLNLSEELLKDLPFTLEDSDEPSVLIYHTHGCESYFLSPLSYYYTDQSFRSTDNNSNITMVGEALKNTLEAQGINVIHDTTLHDDISYSGSYYRSIETVNAYLEKYPSIKVTIDVHRDSLTKDDGTKYRPVVEIDGKEAAQIMIITGSDPTGELGFPTWQENLIFALKLQEEAATSYPGLMRPLMFCNRVYNMHATNASLLFEVGVEVNTFAQATYSAELMGNVVAEVLLEN